MSLANLNLAASANSGTVMTVLHPVDRTPLKQANGSPITIRLLGRDSDTFIRAERRNRKAQRESLMRQQAYTPADEDRASDLLLAECTVDWDGIPAAWLEPNGTDETPVAYTPENAQKLFGNPGVRWLRDEVDRFIGDRGNALSGSRAA